MPPAQTPAGASPAAIRLDLGLTPAEFGAVYLNPLATTLIGVLFLVIGLTGPSTPSWPAIIIGGLIIVLSATLTGMEIHDRRPAQLLLDGARLSYRMRGHEPVDVDWSRLRQVEVAVDVRRTWVVLTEHHVWLELIESDDGHAQIPSPTGTSLFPASEGRPGVRLRAGMGNKRSAELDQALRQTCPCYVGIVERQLPRRGHPSAPATASAR